MATLECPHCAAAVTTGEGWARVAIATLAQSPAVPGMANQVRCPHCRQMFTDPAAGQPPGWRSLWPATALVALLLLIAVYA